MSKRILIVDDEASVLFVLCDALARLGDHCEIVAASKGREALGQAKTKAFDLVITDIRLPDIDGIELTKNIMTLHPDTSFIWITAYGCWEVRSEAAKLGVPYCLDKPVEVGEIRQMARDVLDNTRAEAQ
jgi:DNA-binding NtrC family response regulator